MLRVLPSYAELLRDLISYDVVGFQTQNDLRAFHSGVEHLFGAEALRGDGRIRVGDERCAPKCFRSASTSNAVQSEALEATSSGSGPTHDRQPRRPRADDGRGSSRLQQGPGRAFLGLSSSSSRRYPENLGRITYIQIAPLSRTDVRAYAEIRQSLEQAAGRTNGRFADTDWTPIRYLNRNFPHATLMGFLRAANVGLVTPLRDGMNLVAKEFVAAQDRNDPGVLILSNLAGAARELTSALLVNPYDARAVSHAIQAALSMPLARASRAARRDDASAAAQRHRCLDAALRRSARAGAAAKRCARARRRKQN